MTFSPTVFYGRQYLSRRAVWQTKLSGAPRGRCHKSDTGRERPRPTLEILSKAQRLIQRLRFSDSGSTAHLARLRRSASGLGDTGRTAAVVHLDIESVALFFEARHHRALERAAARQFHAHRVDEAAVDQDFVVDVGAGRHARRPDEADYLALAHALAGLH